MYLSYFELVEKTLKSNILLFNLLIVVIKELLRILVRFQYLPPKSVNTSNGLTTVSYTVSRKTTSFRHSLSNNIKQGIS